MHADAEPDTRHVPMSSYDIGQVVYIVREGSTSILVGRIVEENVVRTREGASTTWIIEHENAGVMIKSDISKMKCEVFTSDKNLKKSLIKRATDALNLMVDGIVQRGQELFEAAVPVNDFGETILERTKKRQANVHLPDGSVERVVLDE